MLSTLALYTIEVEGFFFEKWHSGNQIQNVVRWITGDVTLCEKNLAVISMKFKWKFFRVAHYTLSSKQYKLHWCYLEKNTEVRGFNSWNDVKTTWRVYWII